MDEQRIIDYLKNFVSEQRYQLFCRVLEQRTRYVSLLIENVYQSHNASAIVRTCEALGIQDLYVYERKNAFTPNDEIALGADKWLTINRFNEKDVPLPELVRQLKRSGYRIIATTLHQRSVSLYDLPLETGKMLFMFGTEISGLSKEAISLADEYVKIPMYGFTESFNVSVSVGIIMSYIVREFRNRKLAIFLTPKEKQKLMIQWLIQSIPSGEKILKRYLAENNNSTL